MSVPTGSISSVKTQELFSKKEKQLDQLYFQHPQHLGTSLVYAAPVRGSADPS